MHVHTLVHILIHMHIHAHIRTNIGTHDMYMYIYIYVYIYMVYMCSVHAGKRTPYSIWAKVCGPGMPGSVVRITR